MKTRIGETTIRGSHLAFILVILALYMSGSNLFSQNIQSGATRQSSLEAFSKGDYEKAYNEFSELLIMFPKDPLYKYYSGVCLVKLNRDPKEAVSLLRQAKQGAAVVRTIPSDAVFWLGRARQLSGDFKGALESYNLFTEHAGKKAAKELDVPAFIQQCKENMGQVSEADEATAASVRDDVPSSDPEEKKLLPVYYVQQNENKIITGNETLPVDYDKILSEALDYQYKADSVNNIAEEQKKNLEGLTYREKTDLKAVIAKTENLAASFQKIADQKYTEAQTKMNETESVTRKDTLKVIPDILKQKKDIAKPAGQILKDTAESQIIKKEVTQVVKIPGLVYALFEANVKPAVTPGEKVMIGPEIPEGLIYRIQVAVFRNPVSISYFKGLSPVYGFRVPGTDKINYYIGMFRRLADAKKALLTVRQKGFKDAFIVSLSGGKQVSAERAALLEKEWGKKPLSDKFTSIPADTLPPTLSFRVEVTRAAKPLKDDILEGMKKMAGARGLDSEKLAGGVIIYLIGKFITYESAEDFAGLLVRNGYRDAKVAAWIGKKEIPVETAKQLFERIE